MEKESRESDPPPEGAAPEQVSDAEQGQADAARNEAEDNAGVPNEEGQATGNPANAG